jgi:hypothetical protein
MAVCDPPNTLPRMCAAPWELRYGTGFASVQATYLRNVTFANFNGTDCGGRAAHALVQNPSQTDDPFTAYAADVQWLDTPPVGRFSWSMDGADVPQECADGVGCDAPNFLTLFDADGSSTVLPGGIGADASAGWYALGSPDTTVLGPNPALAFGSPRCVPYGLGGTQGGGIACPRSVFRSAVITSADRDFGHDNLGGLEVTRVEPGIVDLADNTTWPPRTSLARGPIDEMCSEQEYVPRYPHVLFVNETTQLYWPATEPGAITYQFASHDPTDAAVISLFLQRPYAWEVFVQDCDACPSLAAPPFVPPSTVASPSPSAAAAGMNGSAANASVAAETLPGLTDAPGTYFFDPQARRLWVTLRGGVPGRVYTLVRTAAIQVSHGGRGMGRGAL